MTANRNLPLIRAGALMPLLRFLEGVGEPVDRLLPQAGLGYFPFEQPEQPIPLIGVMEFFGVSAGSSGIVDLGCRAAADAALPELGIFGKAFMSAPTVRVAIQRAGHLMRHFSSHETLSLIEDGPAPRVLVHMPRTIEARQLHIAEQYTAMMVLKIVELSNWRGTGFRGISFSADPFGNLDGLRPYFGDRVTASQQRGLTINLDKEMLDQRLNFAGGSGAPSFPDSWFSLGPNLSLREALSLLLGTMLLDTLPSIGEVARVSGMSVRSVQRQLHAEGTSFREMVDTTRREFALRLVREPRVSLMGLSQNLGYGHQSSLTRAVRRWTDESPRALRRQDRANG